MKKKTLGQLLKEHREKLRLSPEELGEKIGYDTTTVWRIENNKSFPRHKYIRAFTKDLALLDVDTQEIWTLYDKELQLRKKQQLGKKQQQKSSSSLETNPKTVEEALLRQPNSQIEPSSSPLLASKPPDNYCTKKPFDWIAVLSDKVSSYALLQVVGVVIIWLLGWWLIQPFFDWPYSDTQTLLNACLWYAAASLFLPFLTCLWQSLFWPHTYKFPSQKELWKLLVLRCFANYTGYHSVLILCLILAGIFYPFGLLPGLAWFRPLVPVVALLTMYIFGIEFPARSIKGINSQTDQVMYDSFMHNWALPITVALGPCIAFFYFFIYPFFFFWPYLGAFILLVAEIIVAIIAILYSKSGKFPTWVIWALLAGFTIFSLLIIGLIWLLQIEV